MLNFLPGKGILTMKKHVCNYLKKFKCDFIEVFVVILLLNINYIYKAFTLRYMNQQVWKYFPKIASFKNRVFGHFNCLK